MLINSKQFEKISIRGCVAYGICCLENALEHYKIQGAGWNLLLKKLWWYTELSAEFDPNISALPLERWAYLNAEIRPGKLELSSTYSVFSSQERWWFKDNIPMEEEYNLLKETYKSSNEIINLICQQLYQIGINELWGGIGESSPDTLRPLQELINLMYAHNISVPPKEPFEQYVFHKNGWDYDLHGFGEMFDGTQYSKFVNSTK